MHRQIPPMYSSSLSYHQSCNSDQRDQKELIERVRRVVKMPLLLDKAHEGQCCKVCTSVSFHMRKYGTDGVKQSIRSTLRTMRHLV